MEQPYIFLMANRNPLLLKGVPIILDGGITIRSISEEYIGPIIGFRPKLSEIIYPKKKCILIPHDHPVISNNQISNIHIALSFALTFFAEKGAIACDRVFRSQKRRKLKIEEEILLTNRPLAAAAKENEFKLLSGTTPDKINTIFNSSLNSLSKEKSFNITIERYISSIIGTDIYSKIIDIAISLESLFSGSQEIKFRFSIFNSIISTIDVNRRGEVFELMKTLYDARSSIVHGDDVKNKKVLEDNWNRIVDIARLAIAYKMNFLDSRPKSEWSGHLERLAIGIEQRLA